MLELWVAHLYSLSVFFLVILINTIFNLLSLKKIKRYPRPANAPLVSILIPARNEEKNITGCVMSLLKQDYPNKEVIVLNDQSTDQTWKVLQKLKSSFPELHIINGKSLPDGWLGKHWACHQLFTSSQGNLILFTDADTLHEPQMLNHTVSALLSENADLLTAIVKLEINSWGEGLLLPFMYWSVLTFFPLKLASWLKNNRLSASVGQFMFFKRRAYQIIGGHKAIKDYIVDDFQLGRNILKHKLNWQIADAIDLVSCRMYLNLKNTIQGFSKNLYPVFNFNVPLFLFVYLYLFLAYLEPINLLIIKIFTESLISIPFTPLIICVVFALIQQLVIEWRLKIPIYYCILYPLTICLVVFTAFRSLTSYMTNSVNWKGRQVKRSWFN